MSEFSMYMSHERYLASLERQLVRVVAGLELRAASSDEVGNKNNKVSWGLCFAEREARPDTEDHLWPDQFERTGCVAPKYRATG